MPIELHGIVKLASGDSYFAITPPILFRMSMWTDEKFKNLTSLCMKAKWDDRWIKMLSSYSKVGGDKSWTEKDVDYYTASVTWRTRDGYVDGIKQTLCEMPDCAREAEYTSPGRYCNPHWLAWWCYLDQEQFIDEFIDLMEESR